VIGMERRQYSLCISCAEGDATPRDCGLDLCDVCHMWVTSSLELTQRASWRGPLWPHVLVNEEPELLTKVRKELQELQLNERESEGDEFADGLVPRSEVPLSEDAWLRYFRWLLGDEHELFKKMQVHVSMRAEAASNGSSSVEEIAEDLNAMAAVFTKVRDAFLSDIPNGGDTPFIPEPTTRMFGTHMVRMDIELFWVDEIPFRHGLGNYHRFAELLFDSMNGLDTRALGDRKSICSLRPDVRLSRWPKTPIFQEHATLLALEYPERQVCNRHRAALMLWTRRRNMEFMTRDVSAWARSFQLLRSVIESSPDVELEESDISVRGRSGTRWQIHGSPGAHSTIFQVTPYDADEKICIGVREMRNFPPGDIIVSVVQMLLDDIKTSETVETLVPHMRQPDGDEEEE